ncbi:hypothetical protein ABFG93_22470 (plasmid) [Pseudalkalibacillus hwajinpoensis]|uniref:hypothetical protein n=1 Tax=Guptibacillus hwajinpoensis TaxID=208199 RepID=UPI00325BF664
MDDPQVIDEAKDLYQEAVDSGDIASNAENAKLNINHAKVAKVREGDVENTTLTIPIVSDEYSPISNLTVVMNNDEILTYTETLLYESDVNTVVYDTYTDDKLVRHEVSDIEYVSNEEVQKELDKIQNIDMNQAIQSQGINEVAEPQPQGFNQVALCLSTVLLVDLTVARIIAGTCVVACAGAPITGAVCAACVGGVVVAGGFNIKAIMACFDYA